MTLSRGERFRLKTTMSDEMSDRHFEWTWKRKNLLLGEFDIGPLEDHDDAPTFEDLLGGLSDADLMEMYSMVTGVEMSEVRDAVDSSADPSNWKPGYVRLFISHSARHKRFLGEVAEELAVTGIHGFVAHDTMAYSKPWQAQIEQALKSMQALVAVVHPEFNESPWCHQEAGWALGRRVPTYVIRMGTDPVGFIGREQWPSGDNMPAKQVAQVISTWASSVPELGEIMTDGLFTALENANNYMDAGATAARIAALNGLTDEQWGRLNEIWWKNDQLYTGALPSKALKPLYTKHGRDWPPPQPVPPTPPTDPWASTANGSNEPVF